MRLLVIWIWSCAYLNCAGWLLSAIHQLNTAGYAIVMGVWIAGFLFWKISCEEKARSASRSYFKKALIRFRKPFPLAYLVLASMALAGGILYPPSNYDALAYRIPRILHWLSEGRWHWIHTIFDRVNDRSCGIEWVSAPFIAIFKTDRFLFLINIISFLFLPGLVFNVFRRLGVRHRVAWHWMWIVPSGYGFLLQAGSIGNDLFGAPFALAAVAFALRAGKSGSAADFFTSILSAAMMTSAKTSSLPLLLPWAIAILPSLKTIVRKPVAFFAVSVFAIFASALPTMVLNQKYAGDWSGVNLSSKMKHAIEFKSGANVVLLTTENFVPPVFPADKWNHAMDKHLPAFLADRLAQVIEDPGCKFHLPQMQTEEDGGLGFGICTLLVVSGVAAFVLRGKKTTMTRSSWQKIIRWAPVISLLAVLTQSNITMIARVLVPYYPLLLPPLLICAGHEQLVKQNWWRAVVFGVFIIAGGLVIISPPRPLFPALTIVERLSARHPGSKSLARIEEVYSVYRQRPDAFAPAKEILPADSQVVGLTIFDEPETSLWFPLGSRRIVHVCPGDTPAYLKSRGVEYILVKEDMFGTWFPEPFDEWLKMMNAEVIKKISLNLRAAVGPVDWYLVKLN